MPRKMRIEYAGAVYYMMAQGNQGGKQGAGHGQAWVARRRAFSNPWPCRPASLACVQKQLPTPSVFQTKTPRLNRRGGPG
jgi:hypothetical protein